VTSVRRDPSRGDQGSSHGPFGKKILIVANSQWRYGLSPGIAVLDLVAVWREANVFTEAERAALELTEQGTRIADAAGGVTDEAWANATKNYDDEQLAALVCLIALINTYNRLNVITRQPGGDYQPGQWG
jgi:hypothetical protein